MAATWSFFLLPPVAWLTWLIYRLSSNYTIARRVGVPIVVLPVDPESPLWMLAGDFLGPFINGVLKWIPVGSGTFTRYAYRGWDVHDRARSFLELGDAWIMVTTGKNWLYICNGTAQTEILQRRNEFKRPVEIMAVLDVFGPNLSTVEGKNWQRHRKATAPSFGEPNMSLVWDESIRQASEMLDFWKKSADIRRTGKDTRRFSLHVLSNFAFGKSYSFDPSSDEPLKTGGSLSYKDSLGLILENCILILILGPKLLTGSLQRFLPKQWQLIGHATSTFQKHITQSIQQEKLRIVEGKSNTNNFISSIVRASEEEARTDKIGIGNRNGLTETEISGNIFVFNFAGHDSIAITLSYVITHLAAHPDVQDWISAEIRQVCRDQDIASYRDAFPRLKRCMAVVNETLRTSTPFPATVKNTGSESRTLKIGDKTLHVPVGMNIISTFPSINYHPRYWGSDADVWRPSRWIETTDAAADANGSISDREALYIPPKGVFMPWSEGDRACPGKKFAQVELLGAVRALFADYKVEPVPENGESMESARERTKETISDSGMVLLIEMLHPERLGLRWVKR